MLLSLMHSCCYAWAVMRVALSSRQVLPLINSPPSPQRAPGRLQERPRQSRRSGGGPPQARARRRRPGPPHRPHRLVDHLLHLHLHLREHQHRHHLLHLVLLHGRRRQLAPGLQRLRAARRPMPLEREPPPPPPPPMLSPQRSPLPSALRFRLSFAPFRFASPLLSRFLVATPGANRSS